MTTGLPGFLLKWSLTLALLVGAALFIDLKEVGAAIERIGPGAFALTVLLSLIASVVLPAISTRKALFADQVDVSLRELVTINLGMRFYTLVLPRGLAMAIRWQRYRARSDGPRATALMLFERLMQLLVLVLLPPLFLALDPTPTIPILNVALAAIALGVPTLLGLAVFLARRDAPVSGELDHDGTWTRRQLARLWRAIRVYRDLGRGELLQIVSLYVLYYLFLVTTGWIVAASMDLPLTWMQMAWVRPVVFLLTLFPLTVNGMGIREISFVGLLGLYGIDSGSAFALGLSLSAVHIVIGALGGLLELRLRWASRRPQTK
ncbi:MAG: flippase-like domain-containing protein [Chromatiales bacterium]|nr:flippase-like domain-containing protein [Chromatiales bacterium]